MTPNAYLEKVLARQTFGENDKEMKELRARRDSIAAALRTHFSGTPVSIQWAGAMAKGTMIREAYDGDVTCYFNHDDSGGGESLEEIYTNVKKALEGDFFLEEKASALRVRERSSARYDLHIDVVPGRYLGDDRNDVNLHRTTGDKRSLKTNLQTHIDHIKGSGVVDAIRLMKLWNVKNGVGAKTFVLELLVVKLLKSKVSATLEEQLKHVWTEFRDVSGSLAVEDPANPSGNDLKPALDACRSSLQTVAAGTMGLANQNRWESIFGKISDSSVEVDVKASLLAAAAAASNPSRPWASV